MPRGVPRWKEEERKAEEAKKAAASKTVDVHMTSIIKNIPGTTLLDQYALIGAIKFATNSNNSEQFSKQFGTEGLEALKNLGKAE